MSEVARGRRNVCRILRITFTLDEQLLSRHQVVIVSDEHVVRLRRLTSNHSDRENSMNFLDRL